MFLSFVCGGMVYAADCAYLLFTKAGRRQTARQHLYFDRDVCALHSSHNTAAGFYVCSRHTGQPDIS